MHKKTVTRFSRGIVGIALGAVLLSAVCYAQIPQMINYQGYLKDSVGNPLDGTVNIVFSIYNVSSGGLPLWSETQPVEVTDGIFSVNLGAVTPITLPFDTQYWLGVKVGADTEMTPRRAFTSVAYALNPGPEGPQGPPGPPGPPCILTCTTKNQEWWGGEGVVSVNCDQGYTATGGSAYFGSSARKSWPLGNGWATFRHVNDATPVGIYVRCCKCD